MDIKRVMEAVQIVRRGKKQVTWDAESAKEYNDALNLVLDTCETVLAVGGKMPEKKKHSDWDCGDTHCIVCEDRGYNRAIDVCTLAFAGMMDRERIFNALFKEMKREEMAYCGEDFCLICGEPLSQEKRLLLINHLADAILSAMKGGVK